MWALLAVENLSNVSSKLAVASLHLANDSLDDTGTSPYLSTYLTPSNIVAVVSFIISLGSAYYTWKTYKIKEGQEIDRKKEMRKANLSAQLIRRRSQDGKTSDFSLRIINNGKAKAKDIKIWADDKPLFQYPPFRWVPLSEKDLLSELGPGTPWEIPLEYCIGFSANFRIKINWLDDSDESGLYEQSLVPAMQ
ncbi:MAG: hypothetical protein ACYDHX_01380 [Methanothrix sp.]